MSQSLWTTLTSYSARIDGILLNVTRIALPGNYVIVNIRYICRHVWYVCSDVRYVCKGQLSNPEK